jgi:hypothetical protein
MIAQLSYANSIPVADFPNGGNDFMIVGYNFDCALPVAPGACRPMHNE